MCGALESKKRDSEKIGITEGGEHHVLAGDRTQVS